MGIQTIRNRINNLANNNIGKLVELTIYKYKPVHCKSEVGNCDCSFCKFIRNEYTPFKIRCKRNGWIVKNGMLIQFYDSALVCNYNQNKKLQAKKQELLNA